MRFHWRNSLTGRFITTSLLLCLPLSGMSQVTITEVTQQEFPATFTSDKAGQIIMNWDSSIKSTRNVTLLGGFYASAEFLLQSDTNQKIDIEVIPINSTPGVSLLIKEVNYQNKVYRKMPVTRANNPGSGSSLFVGMEVDIDPNVAADNFSLSYEVIVTEL